MNKTSIIAIAVGISSAFATDSFGGIGLVIQENRSGISVGAVVPNTPAAKSDLKAGDLILTVDGEALKGKSLDEILPLVRGVNNKPIELTYISDGNTLNTVIRRTILTTKEIPDFNAAADDIKGKKLVSAYALGKDEYKSVFIDDESIPVINNTQKTVTTKTSGIRLIDIDNNVIRYENKAKGKTLSTDLNGKSTRK